MKNQERIYTKTNKSQQTKKDFFRARKINTKLENEAREQVNIDVQEILDGHFDDRSQL